MNTQCSHILLILLAFLMGIWAGYIFYCVYTENQIDNDHLPKFLKEKKEKVRALLAKEEKEVMNT